MICKKENININSLVVVGMLLYQRMFPIFFVNAHAVIPKSVVSVPSTDISSLVQLAIDSYERTALPKVFIAIAGCPGSGKSTIADKVCQGIHSNSSGKYKAKVIPMDGYHIPRKELKRRSELGFIVKDESVTAGTGTCTGDTSNIGNNKKLSYEDIMKRRGTPWTFDPIQLTKDLVELKETNVGTFPMYSREISDPIEDSIIVSMEDQIIIFEGNYLLCYNDPMWLPLQDIFDEMWYIDVSFNSIKERLIERHLQRWTTEKVQLFGEGRNGAIAKIEQSDLLNAMWIVQQQNSKQYATVVIDNNL